MHCLQDYKEKHCSMFISKWMQFLITQAWEKDSALALWNTLAEFWLTHESFFFSFCLFLNLHHESSCLLPSHNIPFTLPSCDNSSQLCSPWTAWTSGPSPGHVPPHSSHPGHPRAAGSLLHACLEPGDHWHLCPDWNGPWYSTFSKCSF